MSRLIHLALSIAAMATLAAPATLAAEDSTTPDVTRLAMDLINEDPAVAMKTADELAGMGWPVIRLLELLKGSSAIPGDKHLAFETRAEEVQCRIESEALKKARAAGQAALERESAETKGGEEGWNIAKGGFRNPLLRRFLSDHVVFTTEYWWKTRRQSHPVMGKIAVSLSTGRILRFDCDPTPLFNAEKILPATAEEARMAADLFLLLTLDEEFDLASGFETGLASGGCHVLEKASDIPGFAKCPPGEEAASRVAPPLTLITKGGFKVSMCVWYELGGRLLSLGMTFRGKTTEVKTEEIAKGVGFHGSKK